MIRPKVISLLTSHSVVIAALMALAALFFYDPFSGIELTEWDRSFCSASLAGIDPSKRVSSFYRLYLFYFPGLTLLFAGAVSWLLRKRRVPHIGISAVLSFLLIFVAYTLRFGSPLSYKIAAALAVSSFLGLWAQVFWVRHRTIPESRSGADILPLLVAKVQQKQPSLKRSCICVSFALALLCALPSLDSFEKSFFQAVLNIVVVVLTGAWFVLLAVRGKIRNIAALKMDRLCAVGAFVLISSMAFAYSRFAVPLLAGHSTFVAEYAERFAPVLFSSSTPVLLVLSFLLVLLTASKDEGDTYRDFVLSIFLSIDLSLLLPTPVVVNGLVAFALFLFLRSRRLALANSYGTLVWFPLFFCCSCELLFVLFAKGVIGFSPWYGVLALSGLLVLAKFLKGRLFPSGAPVSDSLFYVGAFLSLAVLGYGDTSYFHVWENLQLDFQDFYEYGNRIGVVDSLVGGKIPVIDYFSAHALNDVFTGICYGFLQGNVLGGLIDPYRDFIFFSCGGVALFFVLSKFFSPFFAFAFISFFPQNTNAFLFVDVCLVGILLHFWLHRENGMPRQLLFWFFVALLAFYRYDTGVAFGIAAIACTALLYVSRRDWGRLMRFVLSGMIISALLLLFYTGYYSVFHWQTAFGPLDRIREWISLTLHSNAYWAEEVLSPSLTSPVFTVAYLFIPLAEALIVFYVVIESLWNRKLEKTGALALFFAVVGLFLLTRSFVFYTLTATLGRGVVFFCYSVFALSFFLLHLLRQKQANPGLLSACWLAFIVAGVWVCNAPNHFLPDATHVLSNRAIVNVTNVGNAPALDMDSLSQPSARSRFRLDDTLSYYATEFRTVFSRILEPHETFLDFANVPVLYALTEREKPFYSAQSPGLLSDLYSQEMFLKEVDSREVPLAVTGWSNRGYLQEIARIPHQVRFYRIAEYLYTYYRPLVHLGDFVIWCKTENYGDYLQKLKGAPWKLAEYGFMPDGGYHHFDLKWNPYVWANMDKFKAADGPVLETARSTTDGFRFNGSRAYSVSAGKYALLEIRNDESGRASVEFMEEGQQASRYHYDFNLEKGLSRYLVRVSQDYNWYVFNINSVKVACAHCEVTGIKILQGD